MNTQDAALTAWIRPLVKFVGVRLWKAADGTTYHSARICYVDGTESVLPFVQGHNDVWPATVIDAIVQDHALVPAVDPVGVLRSVVTDACAVRTRRDLHHCGDPAKQKRSGRLISHTNA